MKVSRVNTVESTLVRRRHLRTTTGNCDIITAAHILAMKDQAIVCNIGHFDNEIQVTSSRRPRACASRTSNRNMIVIICPATRASYMLAEGRLVNLGCATGHPSFSCPTRSPTRPSRRSTSGANKDKYEKTVYRLPKKLDEEVARLHLGKNRRGPDQATKAQAEYLGVSADGPYKPEHYRY